MDCKTYKWKNSLFLALIVGLLNQTALAEHSLQIGYQGKIEVAGILYTGPGYFKFSLIDDPITPTQNYWLNDAAKVQPGTQPHAATTINIIEGEFTIELGSIDYSNMSKINTPLLEDSHHYLRVWFSTDGENFEQLSPDHQLIKSTSILHTKSANTLDGINILATTSLMGGKEENNFKTTALSR